MSFPLKWRLGCLHNKLSSVQVWQLHHYCPFVLVRLLTVLKEFHLLDGTGLDKHLTHNLALPFAQVLCEMLYYILLQWCRFATSHAFHWQMVATANDCTKHVILTGWPRATNHCACEEGWTGQWHDLSLESRFICWCDCISRTGQPQMYGSWGIIVLSNSEWGVLATIIHVCM